MIPSRFLFDAADKLGVEKELTSKLVESEEYPESVCKLTGIAIQKKEQEYLVRVFYEADDVIHVSILNMQGSPWYINDSTEEHIQVIYTSEKSVVKIVDDAYCVHHLDYPLEAFWELKNFSNFDFISKQFFAHTQILFGFEKGTEISLREVTCDLLIMQIIRSRLSA